MRKGGRESCKRDFGYDVVTLVKLNIFYLIYTTTFQQTFSFPTETTAYFINEQWNNAKNEIIISPYQSGKKEIQRGMTLKVFHFFRKIPSGKSRPNKWEALVGNYGKSPFEVPRSCFLEMS